MILIRREPIASAPNSTNDLARRALILRAEAAGRTRTALTSMNSLSFRSQSYGGCGDGPTFGDQLIVYGDGMYQNVKAHNGGGPPRNFQTPGFVTIAIPPRVLNRRSDSFGGPTYAETGLPTR